MANRRASQVKLHHLLYRLTCDTKLKDAHPEHKELFDRRIARHKKDILEYVTSDEFISTANSLNL